MLEGTDRLAAEANPALFAEYPALARLLGASSLVGKRAAATRARKQSEGPGGTADPTREDAGE